MESLRRHLEDLINGTPHAGTLSCDGAGQLTRGTAVTCYWTADLSPESPLADASGFVKDSGPVYVAVLDDDGRYTFSARISGDPEAAPADEAGHRDDCRALAGQRQGEDPWLEGWGGLDYPTLLHQWMTWGMPAAMDQDGDGRPCEEEYAPDVIERTLASPLIATAADVEQTLSRDDVRHHVEAVVSGVYFPVRFPRGEPLASPDGDAPSYACGGSAVVSGAETLYCSRSGQGDYWLHAHNGVLVSILGSEGRYTFGFSSHARVAASVDDYPAGSTCEQLREAPPGWAGMSRGCCLDYRAALYAWLTWGSPSELDPDGDGRPCETVYPPQVVSDVLDWTLTAGVR